MNKAEYHMGREILVRKECFGWERKDSVEREVKKWDLICTFALNIKHSSMDRGIYRDLSSIKSWQNWICRGAVENLSMAKSPRWIENLSRSYQLDKELRKLARWIEEAVKNLLRRNPEVSMDQDSFKIHQEKGKERLDKSESVEDLLRSYRAWRKKVFQEGKNT